MKGVLVEVVAFAVGISVMALTVAATVLGYIDLFRWLGR